MRRLLMLLSSLAMVLGLGGLATWSQVSTAGQVRHVHDANRSQLQQTLGGLTGQYFQFTFLAAKTAADARVWTLHARDAGDAAALRRFVESSPLTNFGAALVTIEGRPLTVYPRPNALPAATDPGYAPLRQALLQGQPGLSAVMRVRGVPLAAFAVPISRGGIPIALLVAYADVRAWPLQGYDRNLQLGKDAIPYVLDPAGVVAASGDLAAVGHPLAGLPAEVRTRSAGTISVRLGGRAKVLTFSSAGHGWTAVTAQGQAAYSGGLPAGSRRDMVILLVLLTSVVAVLVLFHHKRQQALQKLADDRLYDPLTGLAQRRLFEIRLEAAAARQRRSGLPMTLLYCDLDGFKAVNDRQGHNAGDRLLAAVAARLQQVLREDDFVARLGGDEFAVLLEGLAGVEAGQMIERLHAAVEAPLMLGTSELTPSISIGAATCRDPARLRELLHEADLAMYQIKARRTDATAFGASADLPSQGTALSDEALRPT